jgi:signal transduction histidine kinase
MLKLQDYRFLLTQFNIVILFMQSAIILKNYQLVSDLALENNWNFSDFAVLFIYFFEYSNVVALANNFIHPKHAINTKQYRRAKTLLNISVFTCLFSIIYSVCFFLLRFERGAYLMLFDVVGFFTVVLLLRTNLRLIVLVNLYIAIGAITVYGAIIYSGGLNSPGVIWLVAAPTLALLLANRSTAIAYSIIMVVSIIFLAILKMYELNPPSEISADKNLMFSICLLFGLMLLIFIIALIFEKERTLAVTEANIKNQELSEAFEELLQIKSRLDQSHQDIKATNDKLIGQQKEIVRQSQRLKNLNEDKDYIIEVLAHDLKEPLNSIEGLVKIISMDEHVLSDNQQECISHIQNTVTRSRNLLQKILLSGELNDQKVKVNLEDADICGLLQSTVHALSKSAENKRISIDTQCSKQEITAYTDVILVSQIFQNILSNSIKFSPKGSKVTVLTELLEKEAKIEFKDQGSGISDHERELLFSKYSKLSSKPTDGELSSGLGLSLVKRYADLLGAKILYESNEPSGANFIVLIPLNL